MVSSSSSSSSSTAPEPPPHNKMTQYRVIVREGMPGGIVIRAGFNGHEWPVRVPPEAQPGDSFVFSMTDADHQAYLAAKSDKTADPFVNESAFLEQQVSKTSLTSVMVPNSAWGRLVNDLLVDPQRIVFLGSIFVLAFVFGLVMGALSYTTTYPLQVES